jgi:hypothetical protein
MNLTQSRLLGQLSTTLITNPHGRLLIRIPD